MVSNSSPKRTAYLLGVLGLLVAVLAVALMQTPPLAVSAQGTPEVTREISLDEINNASENLFCPVCENVPLTVCFTAACDDWRAQVKDLLQQGYTVKEIEAYFAQRYGAKTVGTPTNATVAAFTVAAPFIVIGAIGLLIAFTLIRWRTKSAHADVTKPVIESPPSTPAPDDYRARLEAELKERE